MRSITLLVFVCFILTSCGEDCQKPKPPQPPQEVTIDRLENDLFAAQSVEDVLVFLDENEFLKKEFLGSNQYPNDSVLAIELFNRVRNPYIDSLKMDVDRVFGDMDDLKRQFAEAFAFIKGYDLNFQAPKIQTLVTGFGSAEMYVSDSLIILGLDYYAGPDAIFRPNNYPDYILRRFQKEYIVPAVVLILSDKYVATDLSDDTMLADMIYYGKKYHFASQMMPCKPDSMLIWYTGKELEDVTENQHIIWANFLENQLIYETNHLTKEKFLGERPNTYEISAVCPGRIAAWVGWEIVEKYVADNPDVDLLTLMSDPDALKLFNDANYKGKAPGLF